jgi:hypothetical protein
VSNIFVITVKAKFSLCLIENTTWRCIFILGTRWK